MPQLFKAYLGYSHFHPTVCEVGCPRCKSLVSFRLWVFVPFEDIFKMTQWIQNWFGKNQKVPTYQGNIN